MHNSELAVTNSMSNYELCIMNYELALCVSLNIVIQVIECLYLWKILCRNLHSILCLDYSDEVNK